MDQALGGGQFLNELVALRNQRQAATGQQFVGAQELAGAAYGQQAASYDRALKEEQMAKEETRWSAEFGEKKREFGVQTDLERSAQAIQRYGIDQSTSVGMAGVGATMHNTDVNAQLTREGMTQQQQQFTASQQQQQSQFTSAQAQQQSQFASQFGLSQQQFGLSQQQFAESVAQFQQSFAQHGSEFQQQLGQQQSQFTTYIETERGSYAYQNGGGGGGGGCFLTTACVEVMGLPDDCEELTVLRAFRDGYVLTRDKGKADMDNYRAIADSIIAGINSRDNSREIWESVYSDIKKAVSLVRECKLYLAYEFYKNKVTELYGKYAEVNDAR